MESIPTHPDAVMRLYLPQPVTVTVLPALMDNYIFVLAWDGQAVVVDPADAAIVQRFLQEQDLRLTAILNTHHHQDHVMGNEELKQSCGCPVIGPDDPRIPGLDQEVKEGDPLCLGPLQFQVIETPGHGSCDLSYYLAGDPAQGQGAVWCGDTLFCGGCGRLFEGTPEQMWVSLQKLANLPEETLVYCGHEYTTDNLEFASSLDPEDTGVRQRLEETKELRRAGRFSVPSTIGLERQTNPFLRASETAMKRVLDMPDADDAAVFAALRAKKDRF